MTVGEPSVSRRAAQAAGFTLIELLVVVLIIGILVAVAAPSFLGQTQKAHDSAAQQYLGVAYRAAAADSVGHDGDFGGAVDLGADTTTQDHQHLLAAQTVADAINASEPELFAETGVCPADATSDQKHIIVDQTYTGNGDLRLCNDPSHTVWTLTVIDHQLQPLTSSVMPGTGIAAPKNTAAPTISDASNLLSHVQVGDHLSVSNGTWSNTPTGFSYQWRVSPDGSSWVNATGAGATSSSYVVAPADEGDYLQAVVIAHNDGGDRSVTAAAVGPTLPASPVATVAPTFAPALVQVGQQETAQTGTWTGSPVGYSYTWQHSTNGSTWVDASGSGATTSVYTVAESDYNDFLRVCVQATNAGGSTTACSDPSNTAATPAVPVNNTPPQISGTAQAGQTLTASTGSWTSQATISGYSYQWQRADDASFSQNVTNVGSDSSSYVVVVADVGRYLRIAVTAHNSGGAGSASSDPTSQVLPAAPSNQVQPLISDTTAGHSMSTVTVGDTLSTTSGDWSPTPTGYSYTWQRADDASFSQSVTNVGSDSSSYDVVAADYGKYLRVSVQATNAGGSGAALSSNHSNAVRSLPPVSSTPPVVSGTAQEGQTLSTSNGSWTSQATLTYSYQWFDCPDSTSTPPANCTAIASATNASYLLQATDDGSYLRARVTATDPDGQSASAYSDATTAVAASLPIGTVVAYAGASTPSGWLDADGSLVSRAAYSELYAALGTTYSAGDGSTTFGVPDARGRFVVSKGTNGDVSSMGENEGLAVGSRTPKHSVSGSIVSNRSWGINTGPNCSQGCYVGNGTGFTSSADSGSYLVVHYIVKATSAAGMPVGTLLGYAGSSSSLPSGWSVADGSTVSRSSQSALFSAVSTSYGSGDGSTTFNLPDARGRFLVDLGTNGDVSALAKSDGLAVGSRTPYDTHTATISGNRDTGTNTSGGSEHVGGQTQTSTRSTPAYFTLNYVIMTSPSASVPTGAVVATAAPSAIPSQYADANGATMSTETYAGLYAVTGTTFGNPGCNGFSLPDLQGRVLVGLGSNGDDSSLGESEGNPLSARTPKHAHLFTWVANRSSGLSSSPGSDFSSGYTSTSTAGSGAYYVLRYLINVGQTSAPSGAPTDSTAPSISGTVSAGNTVSAATGCWTGSPSSYDYQWQVSSDGGSSWSSGSGSGATTASYAIPLAEAGKLLRVEVRGTNAAGAGSYAPSSSQTVGGRVINVSGTYYNLDSTAVPFSYTGGNQTFTAVTSFTATVKIWGAGAGGGSNNTSSNAGYGGGYSQAAVSFSAGQSYTVVVGHGGVSNGGADYGGGGSGSGGSGGSGGGYGGLFLGAVSQANALLIAGGGGGGTNDPEAGGAGGGSQGQAGGGGSSTTSANGRAGGGGSQSTGGQGGNQAGSNIGSSGSALQGGARGAGNDGGGGGGYFGGGGGGSGNGGAGGGGSGHCGSTGVSSCGLSAASGTTAANTSDADRNGAGTGATGSTRGGDARVVLR